MECGHESVKWFSNADSTARYFIVRCDICNRIGMLGNVRDRSDPSAPVHLGIQWATRVEGPPPEAAAVFVPKLRPGWTGIDGTFWYRGHGAMASIQYKGHPDVKCWMVYCPPGCSTPVQAQTYDEAVGIAELLAKADGATGKPS